MIVVSFTIYSISNRNLVGYYVDTLYNKNTVLLIMLPLNRLYIHWYPITKFLLKYYFEEVAL